ncbi:hypothetical protein Mapa_010610 [Marchantia paleacea]|nr:hypothetical protein Mapa_010610 [Marchantia paleacea]
MSASCTLVLSLWKYLNVFVIFLLSSAIAISINVSVFLSLKKANHPREAACSVVLKVSPRSLEKFTKFCDLSKCSSYAKNQKSMTILSTKDMND